MMNKKNEYIYAAFADDMVSKLFLKSFFVSFSTIVSGVSCDCFCAISSALVESVLTTALSEVTNSSASGATTAITPWSTFCKFAIPTLLSLRVIDRQGEATKLALDRR